ncbi:hypothetical protein KC332_g3697 [Hortaea werneckii]|nr:hypothetical protein KC358_g1779 [Hortaea werneckii]KAI6851624.1 hypothetical protein KC350_g1561 [Hortaea werneckii]KAI6942624.1 hypothetical protein KC341_g2103 [Hortaea werneckii]KAI6948378.1 hypothetical protein KC348_g1956 [Hortaea werneckii]KAI6979465.1 hypothetical protein KC321_g2327 [Hortaea werneckii]
MKFVVLSGLLALSGLSTAVTINFSGWSDNFDCSGSPNINTVLDENQCQSGGIESYKLFPTSDDSNGCYLETYENSNCQTLENLENLAFPPMSLREDLHEGQLNIWLPELEATLRVLGLNMK